MSKEKLTVLGLTVLLSAIFIPAYIALYGWAFVTLWAWFIAPLGMPPLGFAAGLGVSLVAGLLQHSRYQELIEQRGDSLGDALGRLGFLFGRPIFTVAVGLIVKQFL